MRIAIVTDAWRPQVNGVVTTLSTTAEILGAWGHKVQVLSPEACKTVPCPTYPEIPLALNAGGAIKRQLAAFEPDAIHIATEGPVGLAARRYCVSNGLDFTSSYHTRFPEYVRLRAPVPLSWSYAYMRWFHARAIRTLVSTATMERELTERGFGPVARWTRGVDTQRFQPRERGFLNEAGPVFMYVGRVAVEKNIEAFLTLDLPGVKYVVGDGPDRAALEARHPEVKFTGVKLGEALVQHLADADVFVFPSLTDTFGLVILEAMACGVPVAAFPVTGPKDLVTNGKTGHTDHDLRKAALQALELPRDGQCRAYAEAYSWQNGCREFYGHLEPLRGVKEAPGPLVAMES